VTLEWKLKGRANRVVRFEHIYTKARKLPTVTTRLGVVLEDEKSNQKRSQRSGHRSPLT